MVYQSLGLLSRFGHGGQKHTSENATSHIRKTLAESVFNRIATIKETPKKLN